MIHADILTTTAREDLNPPCEIYFPDNPLVFILHIIEGTSHSKRSSKDFGLIWTDHVPPGTYPKGMLWWPQETTLFQVQIGESQDSHFNKQDPKPVQKTSGMSILHQNLSISGNIEPE